MWSALMMVIARSRLMDEMKTLGVAPGPDGCGPMLGAPRQPPTGEQGPTLQGSEASLPLAATSVRVSRQGHFLGRQSPFLRTAACLESWLAGALAPTPTT